MDKLISNIIDEVDEEVENNPNLQILLKEAEPTPEPPDLKNAEEYPSITTDNNSTPNLPQTPRDQGSSQEHNDSLYISLEPYLFSIVIKTKPEDDISSLDISTTAPNINESEINFDNNSQTLLQTLQNNLDHEAKYEEKKTEEYKSPKAITTQNADLFATPSQILRNLSFPLMAQVTSEKPDPDHVQGQDRNNDTSIFAGGNLFMLGSETQIPTNPPLTLSKSLPLSSNHNKMGTQTQTQHDPVC